MSVLVRSSFQPGLSLNFTLISFAGPNAIRVLEELGLLNEVVAKSDQAKPETRPFHMILGFGDHDLVYDVSVYTLDA